METRTVDVQVAALMTAPRYELVYCRNVIERAMQSVGIPLVISGGVFYGQCMQKMLEDQIAAGTDYAVTVDFDSVFTADQLRQLLRIIIENEHIDAIAPLQVRRGKPIMLGTVSGGERDVEGTKVYVGDSPIRAETAHFGLTVIDLKKLATVPKPWFWAKPDSDGRWEGDKVDDDVWFWLNWKEAGHSIYFDPKTRIGHVEEMVVMHDENLQPKHYYPKQWEQLNGC